MTSAELIYELETEVLKRIAYHLSAGNLASADWLLDRLRSVGVIRAEVFQLTERYRNKIVQGVSTEIEEAALAQIVEIAASVPNEVKTLFQDYAVTRILETQQRIARVDATKAIATLAERAGPTYVKAVNRASLLNQTGVATLREAISQAIREVSNDGIPVFTDRAGKNWTPEGYISTVVRTSNSNLAKQIQFDIGDHYGTDLIEVSSHSGARPLCAPYQGRIFSRSGRSDKYPPLSETSYGEAAGLFGINCGHVAYPYWEGLSTKTYSPTKSESQNAEQYAESQQQRLIERTIRAKKRDLDVLQSSKNTDPIAVNKAKEAVKHQQARMREFIDDSGRTRRYDREQIVS